MLIALAHGPKGDVLATDLDERGRATDDPRRLAAGELAGFVARLDVAADAASDAGLESRRPRWVWDDTAVWYPPLLAAGVRVGRCVDLRLCHAILRGSTLSAGSALALAAPSGWDAAPDGLPAELTGTGRAALFELDDPIDAEPGMDTIAEFAAQCEAVAGSLGPGRLKLLLAAESAGALIAAELRHAGLPWRADVHDRLLTGLLGRRPPAGVRPEALERLVATVRERLGAPLLNPDSPGELLKALSRADLTVTSTRSWELRKLDHPVIEPLLEYKKLARLASANGWAWMDEWVRGGRFHPEYVPGGVVTGRWAARGGGALQLPKQVRGAVIADEGWKLVVADAAQLEPRILAGLAGDTRMADAGRGKDLYAGIVASGAVDSRPKAKVAMLGAMYGATTGESARLMPALTRAFPAAIRLVEEAARAGERGEIVTSRLGRSSPRPGAGWAAAQAQASAVDSTPADERRARSRSRDWGRFTRNFVVQSSAAEWALCWMAELRTRLWALAGEGARVEDGPHLVYFLHDEVIVHTPERLATVVADAVVASAEAAGRLLFGDFPVAFPVTTAIVDSYADAK